MGRNPSGLGDFLFWNCLKASASQPGWVIGFNGSFGYSFIGVMGVGLIGVAVGQCMLNRYNFLVL